MQISDIFIAAKLDELEPFKVNELHNTVCMYSNWKFNFSNEKPKFRMEIIMDKQTQADAQNSNMVKDPKNWTTGDEPMTGAQKSYLKTLSEEAHEDLDENLTKAEASERINELQEKTGRGQPDGDGK
jgi:hypothetical protein